MTADNVVRVRTVGSQSVEFDGPVWILVDAFKRTRARYMRSRVGHGWLVPQQAADDVLALLEADGRRTEMTL